MHHEWHRPTDEEAQKGIVAWYVQINTFKPDVQPCPYTVTMMNRRITRWRKDKGVSLPYWVEPLPIVKPLDSNMFYKFHKAAS